MLHVGYWSNHKTWVKHCLPAIFLQSREPGNNATQLCFPKVDKTGNVVSKRFLKVEKIGFTISQLCFLNVDEPENIVFPVMFRP